jgi:hypothetical protein
MTALTALVAFRSTNAAANGRIRSRLGWRSSGCLSLKFGFDPQTLTNSLQLSNQPRNVVSEEPSRTNWNGLIIHQPLYRWRQLMLFRLLDVLSQQRYHQTTMPASRLELESNDVIFSKQSRFTRFIHTRQPLPPHQRQHDVRRLHRLFKHRLPFITPTKRSDIRKDILGTKLTAQTIMQTPREVLSVFTTIIEKQLHDSRALR